MAEYGQARANFQLPVPARFPVAVNPKGPLRGSLAGQLQEKGIITALFPELVQKSFGEIDADLDGRRNLGRAAGRRKAAAWQRPERICPPPAFTSRMSSSRHTWKRISS